MPPIADIAGWRAFVYANDHGIPHIHLRRSGESVAVSIMDGRVIVGELPSDMRKVVTQWLEVHRDEVLEAWSAVREGRHPKWIE